MDKFLSVPVSGQTNMLVSISDVIGIVDTSSTACTITYNSGNTVALGFAAWTGASFRDSLQSAMTAALATQWTNVVAPYVPPTTITGITVA